MLKFGGFFIAIQISLLKKINLLTETILIEAFNKSQQYY